MDDDKIKKRLHNYRFHARMNINYHEKSEKIFVAINDYSILTTIILSSTTIVSVGDIAPYASDEFKTYTVIISATVIALLNAILLALRISSKANIHKELRRQWYKILKSTEKISMGSFKDSEETESQLDEIDRNLLELSANEPPANKKRLKWAYDRACENLGLDSNFGQLANTTCT